MSDEKKQPTPLKENTPTSKNKPESYGTRITEYSEDAGKAVNIESPREE